MCIDAYIPGRSCAGSVLEGLKLAEGRCRLKTDKTSVVREGLWQGCE